MKRKDTILIADDNASLRQVLRALLLEEGFEVMLAADGAECMRMAYDHHPSLILLDILMPKRDGREVCKQLREISDVPIIMLTAVATAKDKVERLADGADDYLTKPFDNDELVARIHAVLRRSRQKATFGLRRYEDGFLVVDFDAHVLLVGGKQVTMTSKEWRLLECFVNNPNRLVTHRELLHYAWGEGFEDQVKSLKVFISHLRKKLGDNARRPRYIYTEREVGYRFQTHAHGG